MINRPVPGSDLQFLEGDVVTAARRLLGCYFERTLHGKSIVVRIVETEAYHETDEASHSCRGRTPRTEVMFGPYGHLYVYFTYGMHYCMNVVTGPTGVGSAVLIRAVEPVEGVDILRRQRDTPRLIDMTNGPAKLCQALKVDGRLYGHDLTLPPLALRLGEKVPDSEIVVTPRIGISKARDVPWRFYIKDNPYVSKIDYTR